MVTDIRVKVEEKVASVIGSPCIICGNSDYTVTFTFDREWDTMAVKTARFLYKRGETYQFKDVVFSGTIVTVPVLTNVEEVYLGVYAGELHTTTPTRIICKKSILCDTSVPREEPAVDIYRQLLETINNLELLPTVSRADYGKALMVREDGHWVVMIPDTVHNQKDATPFRLFLGTFAEWDAWEGDKNGVLFIPTDDNTLEELEKVLYEEIKAKLEAGDIDVEAKQVNGLEIVRDAAGVLKIGNTIIPQKRLLWEGNLYVDATNVDMTVLKLGESVRGKTLEIFADLTSSQYASSKDCRSCKVNLNTALNPVELFRQDDTILYCDLSQGADTLLFTTYVNSSTGAHVRKVYEIIE